jgi:hypothetical protein
MDGLFRCASPPVIFDVAGTPALLRPMTLGVIGSCESFLMLDRRNLAEVVEDEADALNFTEAARNEMRWKAHDDLKADRSLRVVTVDRISEWLYEPQGVAHTAFWCLKDSGVPAFATPAGSEAFVRKAGPAWILAFIRARDHASGTDLLSSLDWPAAESRQEAGGSGVKKFIAWRSLYRKFAEAYHWTPPMTNTLTLYSVKVFSCDEKELGGTKKVGYSDMALDRPKHRPRG